MSAIISKILISILTTVGWEVLIRRVAIDLLHYIAKTVNNDLIKSLVNDLAAALENHSDSVAAK